MQYPFGPLAPDRGDAAPGFCMRANGVLPLIEGYGPAPSLATPAGATALGADPRGLLSFVEAAGAWDAIAFTAGDWYKLASDYSWTSLGGTFNCTDGDDWSSLQFGKYALGTNTTDGLQAYDIESGSSFTAIADAGDPRFVFSCANFIIGLDCLDSTGNRNNQLIKTSGFNDHTNWTSDGADNQPLPDGGELRFGADLKNNTALILQERAVRLMPFGDVGGGAMFGLQKISDGVGTVGAKSCVPFDGAVYWLATDGFARFGPAGLERIGAGLVDNWFLGRVDQSRFTSVQGAVDPFRKIIWWRYPTNDTVSDTVFDDLIGFSWQFNRWVTASVSTAYLSRIATPGYTLDDMDSFGPLDSIDIALDSRFWSGGQPVFAALDGDYKFATFTGASQAAQITGATINSPVTSLIGWATPIDDAPNSTLELRGRDKLADDTAYKTAASKVRNGAVPLRGRGMNINFRWNNAAGEDWTYVKGVDHIRSASGGPK